MQVKDMAKICCFLTEKGLDNGFFDFDHDVIFVLWYEKDGEIAQKLDELGCHWDSSAGCWAHF